MKTILTKILVAALPVMAAALATTGDSLKVVNQATGEMTQASYFTLLPEGTLQMAPHLAGICAVAAVLFAIVFLAMHKSGALKIVKWLSFAGALLAVLPMFIHEPGQLMLPHWGVPLLLMIEFFLCAVSEKKNLFAAAEPRARRLDPH